MMASNPLLVPDRVMLSYGDRDTPARERARGQNRESSMSFAL